RLRLRPAVPDSGAGAIQRRTAGPAEEPAQLPGPCHAAAARPPGTGVSGTGESGLPPLAAYVHIAWCVRKCPYCHLNSHTYDSGRPEAEYIDALIADLELDLSLVHGRDLVSIFFDGGTPSLFSAASLDRLLHAMLQRLRFAGDIEISLEANPGSFEQAEFRDYRAIGINRLSIGIQSFKIGRASCRERVYVSVVAGTC